MPTINRRRPGYTLLELLISIAIFAGVMVLALGAFARSANSSAKSNLVREKSEAARSLIDQISNDFRYIDKTSKPQGCSASFCINPLVSGLGQNSVRMSIKYPNQLNIMKTYFVSNGSDAVVRVQEYRNCTPNTSAVLSCPPDGVNTTTILDGKYYLGNDDLLKVFDGITETTADSGFLSINIVLKPKAALNCDAPGTCYELKTTLVPGAI